MIMSVEEFRTFCKTDIEDAVLEAKLQALELLVRKHTNNNFQDRNRRMRCDVSSKSGLMRASSLFKVGDTVQLSESAYNSGLYTIKALTLIMGVWG